MPRRLYHRLVQFVEYRIFHVDDTPHRIALGVAIGMFVAWTPTLPFQMILAVFLATILRANKAVPVPLVWISNPFTAVPLFYGNYLVGAFLMRGEWGDSSAARQILAQLFSPEGSQADGSWRFVHSEFWVLLWNAFVQFGTELWIGSVLVGLLVALASYPIAIRSVVAYRRRRLARRAKRSRPSRGRADSTTA
jgi:hypothetical protein